MVLPWSGLPEPALPAKASIHEPWLASLHLLDEICPGVSPGGVLESAMTACLNAFNTSALRTLDGRALALVENAAVKEAWTLLQATCLNLLDPSEAELWQLFSELPFSKPDVAPAQNLIKAVAPTFFAFAKGSEQAFRFESGALGRLRVSLKGTRKIALLDGNLFATQIMNSPDASGQDIQTRANALTEQELTSLAAKDPPILLLAVALVHWASVCYSSFTASDTG